MIQYLKHPIFLFLLINIVFGQTLSVIYEYISLKFYLSNMDINMKYLYMIFFMYIVLSTFVFYKTIKNISIYYNFNKIYSAINYLSCLVFVTIFILVASHPFTVSCFQGLYLLSETLYVLSTRK